MVNEPIHIYRVTSRDGWTGGKPNTEVPHEQRARAYFFWETNEADALKKAQPLLGDNLEVSIHWENFGPMPPIVPYGAGGNKLKPQSGKIAQYADAPDGKAAV